MKFIKKIWGKDAIPVFILLGFAVILFITNYKPGTILSGWDNLHPEFDFWLNIRRSLFAVWQEHQGLGLLGGMAHASDLPRQLFLLILSIFFPTETLRYIWTFMMLFVGPAGSYFLIKHLLNFRTLRKLGKPEIQTNQIVRYSDSLSSEYSEFSEKENTHRLIPFLGACFYLFNLATVQMFYVPYEAFSTFYGFLPWVLLASILYLTEQKKSFKNLLFLIALLLMATPAWYVQTFFIVFLMAISIIVACLIFQSPKKHSILKAAKLYGIIFLINSFWLLPVIYFSATSASVNVNSKINQMGTDTIVAMNKEFGTIPDVMLLKGFSFKSVDPDATGKVAYMLQPWIDHLNNPLVAGGGFLLFVIVFIGFVTTIKSKNPLLRGFAWLFILSFVALCINTPPFSFISSILRNYVPLVNQIFRFPYTKFSTLASLVFAILFALGIQTVIKSNRKLSPIILASCFVLLVLFTAPAFAGHLIYDKERTKIPSEYTQLFTFFKSQDQNTRIANFPQSNFWGWNFYNWAGGQYGGSGFLWYGIKQPIVDRNFDVWSQTNENFYFEISKALYSKNQHLFEKILNKYQINWLLVDKNVFDISSNKTLYVPELEVILNNIPAAKKVAVFGKLEVYKIDLADKPKDFVFMSKGLPSVNKYNWNNDDNAYTDNGNYFSKPVIGNGTLPAGRKELEIGNSVYYPFRSLFSQKSQKEKEFNIIEKRANIEIIAQIPPHFKGTITVPTFTEKEKLIPVYLKTQKTDAGQARIIAKVLFPKVILGDKKLTQSDGPTFQIQFPNIKPEQYPLRLNLNGSNFPAVANSDKDIGVAFFISKSSNVLTVSDKNKQTVGQIAFPPDALSSTQKISGAVIPDTDWPQILTINIPKIDASSASFHPSLIDASKVQNCDNFRSNNFSGKFTNDHFLSLDSTDSTACTTLFAPNLSHDQGFAIFIKSKYVQGQALRFWVENTDQKSIPIDTYLPKNTKQETSSFILPPMEQFGNSYAFHFYNSSLGSEKSVNELNSFAAYPIFYNYLKSIRATSGKSAIGKSIDTSAMKISHPNESLYIINLQPTTYNLNPTVVLSQSFNPGWHAYEVPGNNWFTRTFPFIFGHKIKDHVMVNNWENGWNLDKETVKKSDNLTVVILYLPQYLECLGFALLATTFIILLSKNRKTRRHKVDK